MSSWFRRHGMVCIFVSAYLMMTLLVVEQGRTIRAQQALIQQLFGDGLELSSLRAQQGSHRH